MCLFDLIYKKELVHRYDDNHITHYFSYTEFEGLEAIPMEFKTAQGNILKGNYYSYPSYNKEYLVIFCHGIGGGHRSYMREIEAICKQGYQVLAYDNTGCFESGGKNIRGLCESLNCLISCLTYLDENKRLENKKLVLVGHSWGGYAVSNILNYYSKPVHAIVCISGFSSYALEMNYMFKGKKSALKKATKFERRTNPTLVNSSSIEALNNTSTKVLLIHSKDDPLVPYDIGAGLIKEKVTNPNIEYLLFEDRKHNPNYTDDARNYMYSSFKEYNNLVKEKKLKSIKDKKAYQDQWDYFKMTSQDQEVWNKIFEFIK